MPALSTRRRVDPQFWRNAVSGRYTPHVQQKRYAYVYVYLYKYEIRVHFPQQQYFSGLEEHSSWTWNTTLHVLTPVCLYKCTAPSGACSESKRLNTLRGRRTSLELAGLGCVWLFLHEYTGGFRSMVSFHYVEIQGPLITCNRHSYNQTGLFNSTQCTLLLLYTGCPALL